MLEHGANQPEREKSVFESLPEDLKRSLSFVLGLKDVGVSVGKHGAFSVIFTEENKAGLTELEIQLLVRSRELNSFIAGENVSPRVDSPLVQMSVQVGSGVDSKNVDFSFDVDGILRCYAYPKSSREDLSKNQESRSERALRTYQVENEPEDLVEDILEDVARRGSEIISGDAIHILNEEAPSRIGARSMGIDIANDGERKEFVGYLNDQRFLSFLDKEKRRLKEKKVS